MTANAGDSAEFIFVARAILAGFNCSVVNVKNLFSHENGNTYQYIKKCLKETGYYVKEKVLNTMEYGTLPQNRERLYIIGFRDIEHYKKFTFPQPIKLDKTLNSILEKKTVDKYFYYEGKPLFDRISPYILKEGTVYQ